MPSWGIVGGVVAFLIALGTFLDRFFIKSHHKDKIRLRLIALYVWIDRSSFPMAILRVARALSGSTAMWVFSVISIVLMLYVMWVIFQSFALGDIEEASKIGVNIPYNRQQFIMYIPIIAILVLPNALIFSVVIRQFTNLAYRRFNIKVVLGFCVYYIVLYWYSYADSAGSVFSYLLSIASKLFTQNVVSSILVTATAITILIDVSMDWLDDFSPIILLPAIVTLSITIVFLLFVLLRKVTNIFLDVASDPEYSPYAFLFGFVGIILLACKAVDGFVE